MMYMKIHLYKKTSTGVTSICKLLCLFVKMLRFDVGLFDNIHLSKCPYQHVVIVLCKSMEAYDKHVLIRNTWTYVRYRITLHQTTAPSSLEFCIHLANKFSRKCSMISRTITKLSRCLF